MVKEANMTVYDVNLGLAIHIEAPNGNYAVIDLGTGIYPNNSPLSRLRYKKIKFMAITHPHKDHIDDILNFDNNEPSILLCSRSISDEDIMRNVRYVDKPKFEKFCEIRKRYNGTPSSSDDPTTGTPFDGMTIVHHITTLCDKENFNNFSPVFIVRMGPIKIVICGDNETPSFKNLMYLASFKSDISNADVLVAAHHGRESGYYEDFVTTVNPRITIISDTNKSDASAAEKYTQKSRGWTVHNLDSGEDEYRKCLTTRNDGNIQVAFGECDDNSSGVLSISIKS